MSQGPADNQRTDAEPTTFGRRQFLAASGMLGATGLTGVGAASSPETDSTQRSNDLVGFKRYKVAENGLGNAQTDTPPFCPRLITYEGRQYYAYWTHAGKLVVAVRDLPDGDWTQNHTDIQIGTRDGHWTPALGIGPAGHVFLCYNTRGSPIRWRRSTNPEDISSFGPEQVGMTGQNESRATYPEFTRLLDGTLLMAYRQGSSGNGDWIMNRWDGDTESWEPLQHPLTDGHAGDQTFNTYHWTLVQSDDGMLHYFFCWRGTGGVQTNRQLSYARSPNNGETWEQSGGTEYSLPITKESAEVVDPISPGSNFMNNGWATFDPRNDAPHVTYYRDDADGNTQIFHAYLADGEWVIEPATDRDTSAGFGGGGVIGSPIGRMGIVVDDDGDVHILTRDWERGGWPMLIEKLNGEWNTSVLYKRNLTWSDIHIDRERWRRDRVLSFIDKQENIRNVPWSAESLVGISDIDLDNLNRDTRAVESWDANRELVTYAETNPVEMPIVTTDSSFEDTSAALAVSETTVPATPMYARAKANLEADSGAEGEARVRIQGQHGTTVSDPAAGGDGGTVTTDWTRISQSFRAGFANIQVRSSPEVWTDYTLESTLTVESELAGVIFRAQDMDNLYMWQVADKSAGFDDHLLRPHVRENGGWRLLGEVSLGDVVDGVEGSEHSIRIVADGSEITTFLNGHQIDQRTDETHDSGVIGFHQPPHPSRSRHVAVDTITVSDASSEVLFETAFDYDEPKYFDDGEIIDGHLHLENTGFSLVNPPSPPVTITDATLELGYDDPTAFEETVAPHGSDGADTKPLAYMVTVDATGLQGEAPVRNESSAFRDSPTTLNIERATPATPLYGRVTARMEPTSSLSLEGSSWIWYPNDDPAWDVNEPSAEGVRYFRRTFDLSEVPANATLVLNADNVATAWINGTEVGTSADGWDGQIAYSWQQAAVIDVTEALQAGENALAVKAERFGNYAGLIGRLYLSFDGISQTIDTDDVWVASQEPTDGWRSLGFDDSDWPAAQVNGSYGMGPWGEFSIDLEHAAIRMKLSADGETTSAEPVSSGGRGIRTTGWEPIPPAFNGGEVTLQASNARVTAATLELAIRNDI